MDVSGRGLCAYPCGARLGWIDRLRLRANEPRFDVSCWITGVDLKFGYRADDYGSGCRDCAFFKYAAGGKNRFGSGPGSVGELNRSDDEAKVGIGPVVVSGAEIRAL